MKCRDGNWTLEGLKLTWKLVAPEDFNEKTINHDIKRWFLPTFPKNKTLLFLSPVFPPQGLVSAPATCRVSACVGPAPIPPPAHTFFMTGFSYFSGVRSNSLREDFPAPRLSKLPLPPNLPCYFPHGSCGCPKSSHSFVITYCLFFLWSGSFCLSLVCHTS